MTKDGGRTTDAAATFAAIGRPGSRMIVAAILTLLTLAPASLPAVPRSLFPGRFAERPVLEHRVEPHYPADLRDRRIEGRVMVEFVVEADRDDATAGNERRGGRRQRGQGSVRLLTRANAHYLKRVGRPIGVKDPSGPGGTEPREASIFTAAG